MTKDAAPPDVMARRALWLVLAAGLLPACDGSDDDVSVDPVNPTTPSGGPPQTGGSRLSASLSGTQSVPMTTSFASGGATFFVPADRSRVDFTLDTRNLRDPLRAQVHLGAPGLEGPPIFDLSTTAFPSSHQGTLRPELLRPQPSFGVSTFPQAIEAMLRGETYVNVPTLSFPSGDIRGQIGPAAFRTSLGGARVVPPNFTSGSGNASVALDPEQTRMTFALDVAGLSGPPLAARLHVASLGFNGPAIFDLSPGTFDGPLRGSLGEADLRPQPGSGVVSFADAVDALFSGRIYVVVPTTAFPSGEIRGQFGPANLMASSPSTPTLFSPGLGSASFVVNEAGREVSFAVSRPTSEASPGLVLIALGADSPAIFTAAAVATPGGFGGTLTPSNFTPRPELGINTFDDAVRAMNAGGAVVRVP